MDRFTCFLPRLTARGGLVAALIVSSLTVAVPEAFAQGKRAPQNFSVLPVTITSVTVDNGQLFANGLVGATAFRTPLTIGAQQTGAACPILDLSRTNRSELAGPARADQPHLSGGDRVRGAAGYLAICSARSRICSRAGRHCQMCSLSSKARATLLVF